MTRCLRATGSILRSHSIVLLNMFTLVSVTKLGLHCSWGGENTAVTFPGQAPLRRVELRAHPDWHLLLRSFHLASDAVLSPEPLVLSHFQRLKWPKSQRFSIQLIAAAVAGTVERTDSGYTRCGNYLAER